MGLSLSYKILQNHLVSGELAAGKEIGIKIDQTLTQDATGTMAYLQFEAMGIPKTMAELSVSYIDHNTLQTGFENADDHRFLQTFAAKHGIWLSRPGNGICHQTHLERFAAPGKTLLGSDSHTPTSGAIGMIAIGAGGLDVAAAMGGGAFFLNVPKIVNIVLKNKLPKWVAAKDVILEILRILRVKGGVGKILEYGGEGVLTLSVPERSTIANMGAECGATTSIFPSDAETKAFLKSQKRLKDFTAITADKDALYDDVIEIDLAKLEPLIAEPHSPDNVLPVSRAAELKVHQVCIGSCTNSSYRDLCVAAKMLKGRHVHPDVSMTVSPGSKQTLRNIIKSGALDELIRAGARILECSCGPCIGMGQAPSSNAVSLRSFNRNFPGRSGVKSAGVYLASVETCVAAAIAGKIADPRKLGMNYPVAEPTENLIVDDSGLIAPKEDTEETWVVRGPNIKPLPVNSPMKTNIGGSVLIKLDDNITTDHIMPAGAKILPLRSNIPAIAMYVFHNVDPDFATRAKNLKGGIIVAGENYGQGSSREHAAIAPMYLGVKCVMAKSFARIHHANLVNFGILPLVFSDAEDYDSISQGDVFEIGKVKSSLKKGDEINVLNVTKGKSFLMKHFMSKRQTEILLAGGLLNFIKAAKEKPAEEQKE